MTSAEVFETGVDAALEMVAGPWTSRHVEKDEESGGTVDEQRTDRPKLPVGVPPATWLGGVRCSFAEECIVAMTPSV